MFRKCGVIQTMVPERELMMTFHMRPKDNLIHIVLSATAAPTMWQWKSKRSNGRATAYFRG